MRTPSVRVDQFGGPLVSIIIVNFNYAQYIEAAISSVYAQSYENIECIVVDDVSTDSSRDVIERIKAARPDLIVVCRNINGGQSAAFIDGLAGSRGDYVILMDADDVLTDDAVHYHVWAHLSLRIPVGFTSGDMIQVKNDTAVTAGSPHFANFFNAEATHTIGLTRQIEAPFLEVHEDRVADVCSLLCIVKPAKSDGWRWSPTSANCFRRDALRLFAENPRFPELRTYTDAYLIHGISAITGSALINRPLAYYRLHDSNTFARTANLNRVRAYDQTVTKRWSHVAMSMLIDYLFERAEVFVGMLESQDVFVEAADTIDNVYPPIVVAGSSYVTHKIVTCWDQLLPLFGEERLRYWLIRKCKISKSHPLWMKNAIGRFLFYKVWLPKMKRKAAAG